MKKILKVIDEVELLAISLMRDGSIKPKFTIKKEHYEQKRKCKNGVKSSGRNK